jgi:hypothetical protein
MDEPSWIVFIDYYPHFMRVYRKLAKTAWFQHGCWSAFVGHYTHGIFLQLSKPHWYNYDFDGIHIELAVDASCAERQLASLQLHITHKTVLPDRDAFNAYTIPRIQAIVASWKGHYEVSTTKPSERLSCTIPFTPTTFAAKVSEAISQVAQLDTIIDEALQTLWPQSRPD